MSSDDLARLKADHTWNCPTKDPKWNWKNQDLKIAKWYKEVGHEFNFEMAHIVAWDMLLLKSISSHFSEIKDGVAITDPIRLSKIYDKWFWTSGDPGREEWLKLLDSVKEKFDYNQSPWACVCAGASFSREFLDRYSKETPLDVCNDETRIPLYAQCFGLPIHNTNLGGHFLALKKESWTEIEILDAYRKGVIAFHPVRIILDLERLKHG